LSLLRQIAGLYKPDPKYIPSRRFDLDWLRILAFGLLIFYHVGMLYVENWGYHIKSQYLSSQLESLMLLLNPWRMPILWMISGIAIRFVLARISVADFIKWRSYRLLLPLLIGVLVVVPPQLYYEIKFNEGFQLSYWEFYSAFWQLDHPLFENYQPGIWPHIDVNHLWYLRELWTFSLYLLVLIPIFISKPVLSTIDWLVKRSSWLLLLVVLLPIIAIQFSLEETREALGFLFLCYGFLLGWHPVIWDKLKRNAFRALICGLVCYLAIVYFYNNYWLTQNDSTDATALIIGSLIYSLDRLVWVLAALGLGYRFLNRPSAKLKYLSDAVYPFYILHQTAIIIFAYELSRFSLGGFTESVSVILLTFISIGLSYEIIRRTDLLRPFFGLKLKREYPSWAMFLLKSCSSILVIVLGLEIIL
jgi:acyltransferase-like protein